MISRVRAFASFIRFGHSVFALPFALTGAILASARQPMTIQQVVWIVVAMVSARSAAMAFNRLVDARFDAKNPRTAMREIPRGVISSRQAFVFVIISSAVFVYAAYRLSPLCLALSPLALLIVFWYSLTKRFTSYSQLFLGLAMAVAPVGGWLAAGGREGWEPWLLALAIATWVAGFDILYACQDYEFDRTHALHSIPVRFGIRHALALSRILHTITVLALFALYFTASLSAIYFVGVAFVAVLLAYEQSLVKENDLSQVKRAFDLNGYVGIVYFLATATAIYTR